MTTKTYQGGCHCGRVRYEAEIDLAAGTTRCNCTICKKSGYRGVLVAPTAFRLLAGEDSLSDYQFNTGQGHHLFCSHCGVRSFTRGNVPQIGGEFRSINVNCLDDGALADVAAAPTRYVDGRSNTWTEIAPF